MRLTLLILLLVAAGAALGCNSNPVKATGSQAVTPQGAQSEKATAAEQSTAPVPWNGPDAKAVSSTDSAHCGKTTIAEIRGLPGYIIVNNGEIAGIYHSTDRVVSFTSKMVDTGYRSGNLVLLKPQNPIREIYVASSYTGRGPSDAVAYELGGCD